MKKKLEEALEIVNEMTADVEERYPVGLLYVRRLLEEVIAECWDEDEIVELTEEPPQPAA